jgi:replicative DNA helicase
MRVISAEARVALHHMRTGAMTDGDWTRLSRRMPDISAVPLCLQDDGYTASATYARTPPARTLGTGCA